MATSSQNSMLGTVSMISSPEWSVTWTLQLDEMKRMDESRVYTRQEKMADEDLLVMLKMQPKESTVLATIDLSQDDILLCDSVTMFFTNPRAEIIGANISAGQWKGFMKEDIFAEKYGNCGTVALTVTFKLKPAVFIPPQPWLRMSGYQESGLTDASFDVDGQIMKGVKFMMAQSSEYFK